MPFLTENKLRNLVNAGTVYLFAAGTLLKLTDALIGGLDMPSWIMRAIAGVLFAGLPLVLFLAWRKGDEIEESQSAKSTALVARTDPPPARSIAVLPFVNMSSDPEQEFFSDGLSEELLNLLAKIPELQVASRTSAFSFKGKNLDIPTLANNLNVAYVLEGSVRKAGNQIRITAQLIKAADDVHEWSETYDRKLDNIFAIQDEIGAAVVEALKVQMLSAEAPTARETDAEAYALYLKAKYFYRQLDSEGLKQADSLLKQAIAIDGEYAPAWNTLGLVYSRNADIGDTPWDTGYADARSAIEKALELDSEYAEAQASLGWIAFIYQRDLRGAADHYSKAIALQPGNGDVLSDATLFALALGRLDEALALGERTLVRDPVNVRAHRYLAAAYSSADRLAEAEENYRQALALSPGYSGGHFHLARVLLAKADYEAALASVEQEVHPGFKLTGLALVHHGMSNTQESDAAVAALHTDWAEEAAYQIAEVHAFRGEDDIAFEWLNKAVAQNDPGISTMKDDRLLAGLHEDPRWRGLLETVGIDDATLETIEFDVLKSFQLPNTDAVAS
jgi:TolB-like protein/thioredoxin-like negative regulator of GroEL